MSDRRKWWKILIPVLILLAGVAGMRLMILSHQAPARTVRENPGVLVEVMRVSHTDRQVLIAGTGTVQPRREASITPQVSGRVIEIAPNLVAGGFFRAGELLFAIEETDWRLGVDRARAALAQAEVELATRESQAEVARLEWERLGFGSEEEPNPLVLYGPQLKSARAAVASARAILGQAELDLDRTRVHAPFNCRIRSEQLDLGQYLRAGTGVATVAGTDRGEVVVPLAVEELQLLRVPGPRGARGAGGSPATVRLADDGGFEWPGRIVRSLGEVDPRGRMARVVVAVDDPYGLSDSGARPALEVGMFVEATLQGEVLAGVVALPRKALRDGSTVWVADEQDQLRVVPVSVARLEKEEVLLRGGLSDGDRVVLTYVSGAADGLKLRPVDAGAER